MEIEMWSELVAAVQRLIPNATFGEDYEGQIVIYTNLWEASDGTLHENGVADAADDGIGFGMGQETAETAEMVAFLNSLVILDAFDWEGDK